MADRIKVECVYRSEEKRYHNGFEGEKGLIVLCFGLKMGDSCIDLEIPKNLGIEFEVCREYWVDFCKVIAPRSNVHGVESEFLRKDDSPGF